MRVIIVIFLCLGLPAFSQNSSPKQLWKADLPGGNYIVDLAKVSAVSNHSYLLEVGVVVTEVNVETTGAALVRFYQLTPVSEYTDLKILNLLSEGVEKANELQEQVTGINPSEMVQKSYPETTHARTIEYRVDKLERLQALYKSLSSAFERNEGSLFVIQ